MATPKKITGAVEIKPDINWISRNPFLEWLWLIGSFPGEDLYGWEWLIVMPAILCV
jgi:hypothetical protein